MNFTLFAMPSCTRTRIPCRINEENKQKRPRDAVFSILEFIKSEHNYAISNRMTLMLISSFRIPLPLDTLISSQ